MDHPVCACPVISVFLRVWNDGLPDDERDALLRPLIPRLVGTRGSVAQEQRRALMAADWLIRVHTPFWLRMAGLISQATTLEELPEIIDMAQCPSLMPTLNAVQTDAADAWGGAWTSAGAAGAAWDAVWDATWAAAEAAWNAAWAAAEAAAGSVWDVIRITARGIVWAAAWAAIRSSSRFPQDALEATRLELQRSALALVERMIAA